MSDDQPIVNVEQLSPQQKLQQQVSDLELELIQLQQQCDDEINYLTQEKEALQLEAVTLEGRETGDIEQNYMGVIQMRNKKVKEMEGIIEDLCEQLSSLTTIYEEKLNLVDSLGGRDPVQLQEDIDALTQKHDEILASVESHKAVLETLESEIVKSANIIAQVDQLDDQLKLEKQQYASLIKQVESKASAQ